MKSCLVTAVLTSWLWTCTASAADLTFLQPDGTPASGVKFYRSFLGGHGEDMMMGGYEELEMGGSGGDEMMGMGMDMGMGYEMGMDDMGMGMGMEGMQARPPRAQPQQDLAFLNSAPLQPLTGGFGELLTSDGSGKVQLGINQGRRSRRITSHSHFAFAVHESGFSFIPAGTKFSPQIKLRRGGMINVTIPEGIDASKFHVLTCWQNGFAYPSLGEYTDGFDFAKAGFTEKPKLEIDQSDWRFKPRFRWFQSAPLGQTVSVPPGEVRVTLVPKQVNGRALEDMNADELFELLIAGGPSVIMLFTGAKKETKFHQFNHLKSLVCKLPQISRNELPQWGDQPHSHYRLKHIKHSLSGTAPLLVDPPASAFSSRVAFTEFLNKQRSSRSSFQEMRIATTSDSNQVRFELLSPGWFQIEKLNDDGSSTAGIPIVDWESNNGESIAVLANGKIAGMDGAFQLVLSEEGQIATFRSDGTAEKLSHIGTRQKTDAEKLKLVQTLRSELERTMARMAEHRKRLLAIEGKLLGNNAPSDPFGTPSDLFAAPVDPFGGGAGAAVDPFADGETLDHSDPFGGGGQDMMADPFGN